MTLSAARIDELAAHLEAAAQSQRTVTKLTEWEPQLSLPDAYEVQWSLRKRRLALGRRVTGLKMGLTSRAKMKQMGVESPIYGFLLDEHYAAPDAEVAMSKLVHPLIKQSTLPRYNDDVGTHR